MMISPSVNKTDKNCQGGFTLLELVIAMVIFLIVTGSIYGLMQLGTYDRNRASRRSDVLKNARVAVQLIGRDVLNAGLGYHRRGAIAPDDFDSQRFGVTVDADTNRDMVTAVIGGNNINTNNLNNSVRTDTIAFAYRDLDFNGGNVVDLGGVGAGGMPSVPRITTKAANGAAQVQAYDLYLIESDTSQVLVMATATNGTNTVDFAPGDPLGLNQALNGSGQSGSILRQCTSSSDTNCTTYSATMKRVFLLGYSIKADGTMVRKVFGNNRGQGASAQIQELPLAYNIENMQISYILDDGSASENPSAGPDGVVGTVDDDFQGFNRIRQVHVEISVQSTEVDEKTRRPETIRLSSTYSTRNLEYDAG